MNLCFAVLLSMLLMTYLNLHFVVDGLINVVVPFLSVEVVVRDVVVDNFCVRMFCLTAQG